MLENCIQSLDVALEHKKNKDPIAEDTTLTFVYAKLNELFCFRTIGDSFGLIITSCKYSIGNRPGIGLERSQSAAISHALTSIRNYPLMAPRVRIVVAPI